MQDGLEIERWRKSARASSGQCHPWIANKAPQKAKVRTRLKPRFINVRPAESLLTRSFPTECWTAPYMKPNFVSSRLLVPVPFFMNILWINCLKKPESDRFCFPLLALFFLASDKISWKRSNNLEIFSLTIPLSKGLSCNFYSFVWFWPQKHIIMFFFNSLELFISCLSFHRFRFWVVKWPNEVGNFTNLPNRNMFFMKYLILPALRRRSRLKSDKTQKDKDLYNSFYF